MPEWTAPFRLPKFTTEEYRKKKAEYVAKHGYTIYVPGWSDIIHIKRERPLTQDEAIAWINKEWDYFSEERYAQIVAMKEERRRRFERMLASPTPDLLTNAASVMTALDNAQDALTTLAVLGRVAASLLPRAIARFLEGPVGWIFSASMIINYLRPTAILKLRCLTRKRIAHSTLRSNPFCNRIRIERARKLKRVLPTQGEICEILQTTDEVFGVGICLGPILGLIQDVFSGAWRAARGQKVTVHWSIPELPYHAQTAAAILRHIPLIDHFNEDISDEDHLAATLAHNYALQVIDPYLQEWHPLDNIEGLEHMELVAPAPTNPLTREVIQEAGYDPDQLTGWPGSSRKWSTITQIWDATRSKATENFKRWCKKRPKDRYAYLRAMGAQEAVFRTYCLSESFDEFFIEDTPETCFWLKFFHNCYTFREVFEHEAVDTEKAFMQTQVAVRIRNRVKYMHPDLRKKLWLMFSPYTVIYPKKKEDWPTPDDPLYVPPPAVTWDGDYWELVATFDPLSPDICRAYFYSAHPLSQVYTAKWLMELWWEKYHHYLELSEAMRFPPGWQMGDPWPRGVFCYPGFSFPDTWEPGDPTPPGCYIPEPLDFCDVEPHMGIHPF
ncbi:MAG: hypothetical protein JRD89_04475, partial [Deltaproteobacteria bacterium]|nr:hypothetical protein [Deltaproteobacteria bacterium]